MKFNKIDRNFYCGFNAAWLNIVSFVKELNTTNEAVLIQKENQGLKYFPIIISDNAIEDARNFYKAAKRNFDIGGEATDLFLTGNKLYDLKINHSSKLQNQSDLNAYFYEVFKPMKDFIGESNRDTQNSKVLVNKIHVTMSSGVPYAIAVACLALKINVEIYITNDFIVDNIFGDYIKHRESEVVDMINDSVAMLTDENYYLN